MSTYWSQLERAKQLGITWIPNTQEGLEFAIEYFSRERAKEREHEFGYGYRCKKCGAQRKMLELARFPIPRSEECSELKHFSKTHNIDIDEIVNAYIPRQK